MRLRRETGDFSIKFPVEYEAAIYYTTVPKNLKASDLLGAVIEVGDGVENDSRVTQIVDIFVAGHDLYTLTTTAAEGVWLLYYEPETGKIAQFTYFNGGVG